MKAITPNCSRAFTLIELLTVIAIIGILAAILIPTVSKVRSSANAAACLSNMRQLALSLLIYSEGNRGVFPDNAYATRWDRMALSTASENPGYSAILKCRSDKIDRDAGTLGATIASQPRSYSLNPVLINYDGSYGTESLWGPSLPGKNKGIRISSIVAPSRMLMLVEYFHQYNGFTEGRVVATTAFQNNAHGDGMNGAFCDGSAKRIKTSSDLLTRPGGTGQNAYEKNYLRNGP
ncbi:type II secretion system protein [Geminisphaera colitermitum]|uniref:type II secretion system protein n=1 Tax=Geminisphaera colitermitum TaxID=1148786 RepID=UPI000158CE04|nr:prepilin-type N-terminal cleavage/methylation domain-containing protein [Geminisphaera colitermitum]